VSTGNAYNGGARISSGATGGLPMTNPMTRRETLAAAALGLAAAAAVATEAEADQPNMRNALASLQDARRSLQAATANKGGHRANAIKLVDAAIAEVKAGIAFAG
jgi:hypothetical protein